MKTQEDFFDPKRLRDNWDSKITDGEKREEEHNSPMVLDVWKKLVLFIHGQSWGNNKALELLLKQAGEILEAQFSHQDTEKQDNKEAKNNKAEFAEILDQIEDIIDSLDMSQRKPKR